MVVHQHIPPAHKLYNMQPKARYCEVKKAKLEEVTTNKKIPIALWLGGGSKWFSCFGQGVDSTDTDERTAAAQRFGQVTERSLHATPDTDERTAAARRAGRYEKMRERPLPKTPAQKQKEDDIVAFGRHEIQKWMRSRRVI